MSGADVQPVGPAAPTGGRFVVDLVDRRWWWSEGLYRLLGYSVGEVAPSSALVTEHTRPETRALWDQAFARWRAGGESVMVAVGMRHRTGRAFDAVVVGSAHNEPAGSGNLVVDGYVVDLGATGPTELPRVDPRIAEEVRVRESIDQAKGVVTAALGTEPEMSFDLLREAAIRNAVPLRMLARHVVAEAPHVASSELEPWLCRLLQGTARRTPADESHGARGETSAR
jgi:hypothetical protein